eukprot:gene5259-7043_t
MSTGKRTLRDARNGAVLQMVEAASLGMPLEVWKTHLGRHRDQTTFQGLKTVYQRNGGGLRGVLAFWRGTTPKMVESATKGSVLMFSKEMIRDSMLAAGVAPHIAGFAAGAGGGVCQVSVMGPCTYIVTTMVNGDRSTPVRKQMLETWKSKGIRGFYPGGTAIAFRQATNWASRQGFTDTVREGMKRLRYDDPTTAKLTVEEEVVSGIIGGTMACWNHPFEVARIEAQTRAAVGEPALSFVRTLKEIVKAHGIAGLFKVEFVSKEKIK